MNIASTYLDHQSEPLSDLQRGFLEPYTTWECGARRIFHAANRALVRSLFRLHVVGMVHLPAERPFIIAPTHTSSLDPSLLAAAIPFEIMRRTKWATAKRAVMKSPFRRFTNRLGGSVPVHRNGKALAAGFVILEKSLNLIWFPEGHRTRDGKLQELKPGIGILAFRTRLPVVPVRILGGYEAMPPGKKIPRLGSRIDIHVREPLWADGPSDRCSAEEAVAHFLERLDAAYRALGD